MVTIMNMHAHDALIKMINWFVPYVRIMIIFILNELKNIELIIIYNDELFIYLFLIFYFERSVYMKGLI
jgi:hypothetical protein